MKTCAQCKISKPETQFSKDVSRSDGKNPYCISCTRILGNIYYTQNKERVLSKSSRWHRAHPEKSRESTRQWRLKNKSKIREKKKIEYDKNKDQITKLLRDYGFKKKFGITLEDRNRLADSQNRECAICGKHENVLSRRLAVDHDHVTKRIRGLLCEACNLGLGKFGDNIDLLKKAIEYLNRVHIKEESA